MATKKTKAERQAELGMMKAPPIDELEREESMEDLLGDDPIPTAKVPKVRKESVPRVSKGKMVTFLTQKGQRITGYGVEYYVTRCNGKLHYKEASQVVFLPDGWKDGDPIPELDVTQ